jgi:hypothetical protein
VLEHSDWQTLLGVQTQADLDALAAGFDQVRMRCIELAIHDALKEGDKRDTRPADWHGLSFANFYCVQVHGFIFITAHPSRVSWG